MRIENLTFLSLPFQGRVGERSEPGWGRNLVKAPTRPASPATLPRKRGRDKEQLLRALQALQRLGDPGLAGHGFPALLFLLLHHLFGRALHELRIVELGVAARDISIGSLHLLGEARALGGKIDDAL